MYHSEILPLSFKLQKRPGHCPCRARRTLPSPMKSTTGPTVAAKLVGTNSQHAGIILGIGDSPQQAKSVQVLPEHCLRLPQMGLLHVQAVFVQKKIIDTDYQNALLGIPGSRERHWSQRYYVMSINLTFSPSPVNIY